MVAGFFNLLVVDATADEEEEYSESGFAGTWVSCRNMVLAGNFLPESGFDDEEDEDLV